MTNTTNSISTNNEERDTQSTLIPHWCNPKTAFIALIALYYVVLMHYFQHNYGGTALNIPINPLGWIIVSALVGLGLMQIIKTRQVLYNKYLIVVAISCCLLLIPLAYSGIEAVYSYSRLLGLFVGLFVLTAFYQMRFNHTDRNNIIWLMLVGVLIESLFALSQFYVFPHIPALQMNIARPSAIFFQANVAATFFATGLLITLYLTHTLPAQAGKLKRALLLIAPLTITIAIVLLQSRTGFLGCIIGVAIWLIVYKSIPKSWLVIVITAITLSIASLYILSDTIRDAKIYTQDSARSQIYSDSIDAIKREPLLGHGYGSFGYTFREQQALAFQEDAKHPQIYKLSHPHNELLLWGIEGGLVSLIPLFIILFFSAKLFIRNRDALALLAIIFPISLHLFTEFPFYHSVASYLTFLLLLGLISAIKTQSKPICFNYPQLTYGLVVIALLANAVVMLNLLSGQHMLTQAVREQKIEAVLDSRYIFMSEDFELILNETLLNLAIAHNIEVGAIAYNKWVLPQIESFPHERYFRKLHESYLFLNKPILAKQTLERAATLFPTLDWTKSKIKKVDTMTQTKSSSTISTGKTKINQIDN